MKTRRNPFLFLAGLLVSAGTVSAATLYWDGNNTSANADGGAGTWDTTTSNWNDADIAGNAVTWPASSSGDDDAVFGGAAGTVTIDSSGITANDITFLTAGYLLTGGALTLDSAAPAGDPPPPAPTPTVSSGVAATIDAPLAGTLGLRKSGNGLLTLSGNNTTLSGALSIGDVTSGNNGGLRLNSAEALGGLTSISIENNSFLQLGGLSIPEGAPITVASAGGTAAPEGAIRGIAGTNEVLAPVAIASGNVRFGNLGTLTTFAGAVTAAPDSGFGLLIRRAANQGIIFSNENNYWEGQTQIHVESAYFLPGCLPDATNLTLANSGSAWFETNGEFTRSVGTAAGQVQFNGTAGRVNGFSARGGELEVNLGGNEEPTTLVWGVDGFGPAILGLAGPNATDTLTWKNPIDLNAANRTIDVQNGSADIDATLTGTLSGASGSAFTKQGRGVLELTIPNSHPGGTTIAGSQGAVNPLRISHPDALGTGNLNIGGGGNNDQARLELSGGITITNTIPILTSRNNDAPNFFNVDGENTITSNIGSAGGGTRVTLFSDDGNLLLTGNISTRQLNLRGEGNGELSGNVPLSTGYGLNKADGGTWIISGNATYPGTTTISGGTLQIGKGGETGTLPAGDVSNSATLVFNRAGELTVAAKISGSGNLIKQGSGKVTLSASTLDYTGTTAIDEGALLIQGNAIDATGEITVGTGSGEPGSARLGGNGEIGGAVVLAADGAIAPGDGVGDLLAHANVSGSGSLQIEVDADLADVLSLQTGTLDISSMSLDVSVLQAPTEPVYIIVNADSAITGAAFAAVNGLPAGYSVVYNYDHNGDTHNIALVGTPTSDPYDSWASANGLTGPDALPEADPDQDGFSNLMEFILGGQPNPANPNSASQSLAPTLAINPTEVVFSFRRTAASATKAGLTVSTGYSTNLTGWSTATDGEAGITITITPDGFGAGVDRVDVTMPRSLAADGKLFARLQATLAP